MHEHVSGLWKGTHREALPENRTVCLPAPQTPRHTGEASQRHPSRSHVSCSHLGHAFQTQTKS